MRKTGADVPKRDPSDKSLLPEVITSALRARLRGLADVRAAREGSVAGYRVLSGAGFAQLAASKGIAG